MNQDFLSSYLDQTLDTYHNLLDYAKQQCIPLMDQSDVVDFVDFYKAHYVLPKPPKMCLTRTRLVADSPEVKKNPKVDNDGWTTV